MRLLAAWKTRLLVLTLLGGSEIGDGFGHGGDAASSERPSIPKAETCESRTINYITHTLPQQCLRTSWPSTIPSAAANATDGPGASATAQPSQPPEASQPQPDLPSDGQKQAEAEGAAPPAQAQSREEEDAQDLATSSFMSFEEWKAMMLKKEGLDSAEAKARRQREHRAERDPTRDLDSWGDDMEIALDFDALSEKVSEITNSAAGDSSGAATGKELKEQPVLHDDGRTQYYRSKDAGKTCKERFSYSSFDAGATVLKTSPGAKNPKAILVENKDSYMLLECNTKNKFVIVELSDDILVDTVVLSNYEFFSSMIRDFRVSVSDRYPVKIDKWVDLGTFTARNTRDTQAFLVEHPQIYTKYIRIEFLTHYGNEYYCPVSLLRVHGTRMLDTWKEPDNDEETIDPPPEEEQIAEPVEPVEPAVVAEETPAPVIENAAPESKQPDEQSLPAWHPFEGNMSVCFMTSPTVTEPDQVSPSMPAGEQMPVMGSNTTGAASSTQQPPAKSGQPETSSSSFDTSQPKSATESRASAPSPSSAGSAVNPPADTASVPAAAAGDGTAQTHKQPATRANATDTQAQSPHHKSTVNPQGGGAKNKSSTTTSSAAPASPTVQESFFKTVTKRLQLLESNTSLSLKYIEDQSRFLQEALHKMEKKHVSRVDAFLDGLNNTVLSELRSVRGQYDQIWQSTVLALEAQREQSQREMVALGARVALLADEVVFQKRMAIFQSLVLLSCLVLVIFSRGGGGGNQQQGGPGGSWPSNLAASMMFPAQHGQPGMAPSPPTHPADGGPGGEYDPAGSPTSMSPSPMRNGSSNSANIARRASDRRSQLSRSASYSHDKVLPLTPTSDFSREPTPSIRIDGLDVPFFEHLNNVDGTSSASEAAAAPEHGLVTPPRSSSTADESSSFSSDQGGDGSTTSGEEQARRVLGGVPEEAEPGDSPPAVRPLRSYSTLSQKGGVIKPLPALPEDPS